MTWTNEASTRLFENCKSSTFKDRIFYKLYNGRYNCTTAYSARKRLLVGLHISSYFHCEFNQNLTNLSLGNVHWSQKFYIVLIHLTVFQLSRWQTTDKHTQKNIRKTHKYKGGWKQNLLVARFSLTTCCWL
jgi:hypothetical protein